ncbi:MAG: DUF6456 domain-containing protein [Alphaproteobacteria bacterium]|nr:DUF6456 domain-containing protein [Alphaproteobacteria bacterium]
MASRRTPVSSDKRFRKIPGGGDHGTPERWQHAGRALEVTDRAGILAARVLEEHILDVLALKRLLDRVQVEAGLRLKADYHAASLASHVTASYATAGGRDFFRTGHERSDAQEAAYKRWRNAVRELGPRYGAVVVEAVCYDAPPSAAAIALLQGGLSKLAGWYGFARR